MKKQKVITFIITILIISSIFLTGCGGGKPEDLSDEAYDIAVDIVRVADFYDNGTYSSANAYTLIDSKYEKFCNIDEVSNTYINLNLEISYLKEYIKSNNQVAFSAQLEQIKGKLGIE